MGRYSDKIKKTMVSKLCTPGGPSVYELAEKSGISPKTLYNWVKVLGEGSLVGKSRRPEDWSPEEKLQAIFDTLGLDEQDLGEYLRKNGLHSSNLEEWKSEALADASSKKRKPGRPKKDPDLVAAEEELKRLKRDLRRKDRALAEQTAIVILQKKAKVLWGTDEDDE